MLCLLHVADWLGVLKLSDLLCGDDLLWLPLLRW